MNKEGIPMRMLAIEHNMVTDQILITLIEIAILQMTIEQNLHMKIKHHVK